jgi:hypothetical protein
LAGLSSQIGTGAGTIGNSFATILQGSLGASSTGISMAWRSRAAIEIPGAGGNGGNLPLYSDVVNLTGVTGGSASTYVLSMSFDPSQIGSLGLANAASGGFLYLGYRSSNGHWQNATAVNNSTAIGGGTITDGNTAAQNLPVAIGQANAIPGGGYLGSYAQFTAYEGTNNLTSLLGGWGVSTVGGVDTAWAVVDHDAEFAVVPEPGTFALLAGGAVALGIAYRRRKTVRA